MGVTNINPLSLILGNIYLIMALQLALNWTYSDCGSQSNLFQLFFIAIMVGRLFLQEFFHNRVMPKIAYSILMFLSSGIFLLGLGIYQSINIATHSSSFYYDPDTKTGSEICFQNRIVFVGEIIIGFLTFAKDVYFVGVLKQDPEVQQ